MEKKKELYVNEQVYDEVISRQEQTSTARKYSKKRKRRA